MKKIIIAAIIILGATTVSAQPAEGNPGGAPAPFGFVELLIAAGAAYGGKKAYDVHRKEKA